MDEREPRPVESFARFLYNHNPFYVISAVCVLFAAHQGLSPDGEPLVLGGVLLAYGALLLLTGAGIVRLGGVWDDSRSLFLLGVMMLLVASGSVDEPLLADFPSGAWALCVGFAAAVVLSEATLHLARLPLGGWFRAAYYGLLATFFLWPGALAHFALAGSLQAQPGLRALILHLGFPSLIAAAGVFLIPAVRRYRRDAGGEFDPTAGPPWNYPMYPLLLFAIMGVVALVRARWVLASFGSAAQTTGSGWALLAVAPVILVAAAVLLELGAVTRRKGFTLAGLALPTVLLGTAGLPGWGPAALSGTDFAAAGPLLVVAFFAYARLRSAVHARDGLVLALLVLGGTLQSPVLASLAALGVAAAEASALARTRSTGRWVRVICVATLALTLALRNTWFLQESGALPLHLLWAGLLLVGLFRDGDGAEALRELASLGSLCVLAAVLFPRPLLLIEAAPPVRALYASGLLALPGL
ncbi:MAG: hypothetical protein ACYTFT_12315, partial [Planctomycetota bacterium]